MQCRNTANMAVATSPPPRHCEVKNPWDAYALALLLRPHRPARELVGVKRLGLHGNAVAGLLRRHVAAVLDPHRIKEVLVQVIDVFEDALIERRANADVIKDRQMLNILAQADTAGMRADRHAELGRHQQHRQHLVDPAEPAGVDLTKADRIGLQQLLEDNPVLHMLAGGHADRRDGASDCRVAQHIVGAGRLLDPQRVEGSQPGHVGDRLADIPDLVGIHHQDAIWPDLLADDLGATHVVVDIAADLHLDVRPATGYRLAQQRAQLIVGIAQPACRRSVGWEAALAHLGHARRFGWGVAAQQIERLGRCQRVGDVAEIDAGNLLFRRHVREQQPERLAGRFGIQIPDSVDHGGGRQVDDALFRANPAQLAIAGDQVPEGAHIGRERLKRLADDQVFERLDRCDAQLIAAADREGQAVAFEPIRAIGFKHNIGGRVIWVAIHGIGAVEQARCGEADVACGYISDCDWQSGTPYLFLGLSVIKTSQWMRFGERSLPVYSSLPPWSAKEWFWKDYGPPSRTKSGDHQGTGAGRKPYYMLISSFDNLHAMRHTSVIHPEEEAAHGRSYASSSDQADPRFGPQAGIRVHRRG